MAGDDAGNRRNAADTADARRSPADARLLLDVMLGKLTTYLRMAGYDAAYALDRGIEADDRLLDLADAEDRLLVTRDADLARRADGLLLESRDVTDQLRELTDAGFALGLSEPARCSACNAELAAVDPAAETPDYAPDPAETRVWRCPACGQHFWKGSHWASVAETLADC
ncbi:Mut7-C RNAse domain-containing protein [Halorussus sp. AFM4]|uniref:Mut7-C RNAse domain-containing protein n=1 Tax=Halorussus sp. AFM4 TaxID=3421651 RepID=UPI003EBB47B2